ncbi:MAG: type II secretion system minor pseudopilin GspI [Burkholderiaceae bacterium]|nr:type II secretion system minor pseudopilin GspI [Burkholderiaceae bacterium]
MKRVGARWRATDRQRGFTLLEVLVALVIIGVALAAAMRGAMALTQAAEDARLKLLATLTAENRLLELRLARQRLELGQISSECEQGGRVFTCEQIVKSTPNPFFRRVELQVFVERNGTRRQLAEMMTVLPTNQ